MKKFYLLIIEALLGYASMNAQHPSLLLTEQEKLQITNDTAKVPLFDDAIRNLVNSANNYLTQPISVPIPVDGGGGEVHEQHKNNYYAMFNLGLAYQYTRDEKYARKVANMLLAYSKLYPTLGLHPLTLSNTRGRLFWQTLNESVWLVHTAIAYDCIYNTLTQDERKDIEKNLLLNMADFIMNGYKNYKVNHVMFNRMHNHATWATAAVGMTGLVTGHDDLVKKALYGSDETGHNGGFLQQMDELFSPDGYYNEGAYYGRYAIWPFVVFAQCIDHKMPELKIFERRNGILKKALESLCKMSYNGEFFHFNDALQKGLSAQELVYAIDILYNKFPEEKQWLSIVSDYQHRVLPIMGGYHVAKDIAENKSKPIYLTSCLLRDGKDGSKGGVSIMREKDHNSAVAIKATSQGMGHGHFDKLSMVYYDNGHEILSDYGSSRFLNIEAKHEGHYTRENDTYAKQTIAHNTVTVDGKSDYDGKLKVADLHHSDIVYTDFSNEKAQLTIVADSTAYPGVMMKRAVCWLDLPFLSNPLLIDVYKLSASEPHQYDYALWYNGTFVSANYPYAKAMTEKHTLGTANGYQHIWLDGESKYLDSLAQVTFFNGSRFYTLSTATVANMGVKMVSLGANDPDFNLLDRHGLVYRATNASDMVFATALETHGKYDVVAETSSGLKSSCHSVKVLENNEGSTVVCIDFGAHNIFVIIDWNGGWRYTII